MNTAKMATVLREHADKIQAYEPRREEDLDTAELVRVLARVVEGKPLAKAFGAPGDWGYGTPIGDAIAASGDRCGDALLKDATETGS